MHGRLSCQRGTIAGEHKCYIARSDGKFFSGVDLAADIDLHGRKAYLEG